MFTDEAFDSHFFRFLKIRAGDVVLPYNFLFDMADHSERILCNKFIRVTKTSAFTDKDIFWRLDLTTRAVEICFVATSHLVCALAGEPVINAYDKYELFSDNVMQGAKGFVSIASASNQMISQHCNCVQPTYFYTCVGDLGDALC